ncbi:coiled-coil domain-containing protein 87 [Colossoma macropomum]|uniref:coiled-coil domain-containing protein 87 n=1 Tax=Colossoma macropomum TaxID=42526 RepID=UPI0018651CB2|nr:coiled-coil domain-containing protein 87 [Colossoma macropomum]
MAGRMINKHSAARDMSRRPKAERMDMMLSMSQIVTHTQETQKHFQNILSPLSLFSHTDMDNVKKRDKTQEGRAQTSASEEITDVPASLSEFCQQLRNRITQQSLPTFSSQDHETLATVIMAELSLIWQDLRGLPADPTLTSQENQQLRSRTFGEVLCICEQLYLHYLHLLETLARREVFSHQINCSRLAAHMAMDLSRLLNAHSIQRSVAAGIKAMRGTVKLRDGEQGAPEVPAHVFPHRLHICPHIKPKKRVASKQRMRTTIEEDLAEIQEKIGELDLERVYDLMPCHPELITSNMDRQCCIASVPNEAEEDGCHFQSHVTRLKGCNSMPDLQRETLLEELEMEALPARPLSPSVLLSTNSCSPLKKHINPAEDLKRLLQDTDAVDTSALADSEADIPPLIRALAGSGSSKLEKLTQVLQRLEEEEEEMLKKQLELARPLPPQSDVESVKVSTQGVARIAAARVSDRVLTETVNISMYPPVYNDLTGEIEPSSVTWLDRNLFGGAEIKEVYKELSKSLSDEYLHFDEDPMIEPALSNAELLHGLKRNHEKKLMNPSLRMPNPCGISHRKRMKLAADRKRPAEVTSRAYVAWHQWWKSNLSLDDYLNYISNQESDYLSAVFHLYNSDDSDEEDEKRKMLQLQREKIRKQREKMDALKKQKQAYQSGLWNVNTVLMGGLWKEPVPDEVEGMEKEIQHVGTGEDHTVSVAEPVDGEQVQARLEKIWTILCLPETQRLDMAIKYSSHAHRDKLEEATAAWEQAAQLIQQRERVLSQLEQFEKVASDPSRFFQHGYHGTSAARMEEANHRQKLESQIAALEKVLSKTIHHISAAFNDTVTYKGRPYREKMRWDRIEMLYWLQQERRVQMLEKLVEGRGSLPARLPPLDFRHGLYPGTEPAPEDHCPLDATFTTSQSGNFAEIRMRNFSGLYRALTATPVNTFGVNWNVHCDPGLYV